MNIKLQFLSADRKASKTWFNLCFSFDLLQNRDILGDLVGGNPLYLGREDVFDLSIFSRGVRSRNVRVAAAADSGLEKHTADCGCCGPTHGAVTDLC